MNDFNQSAFAADSRALASYHHATICRKTMAYLDAGKGLPVLLGHSYL